MEHDDSAFEKLICSMSQLFFLSARKCLLKRMLRSIGSIAITCISILIIHTAGACHLSNTVDCNKAIRSQTRFHPDSPQVEQVIPNAVCQDAVPLSCESHTSEKAQPIVPKPFLSKSICRSTSRLSKSLIKKLRSSESCKIVSEGDIPILQFFFCSVAFFLFYEKCFLV